MVSSLYFELVPCALFLIKHMEKDQEKLVTASFHSNISMWVILEGNAYSIREASICSK